MFQALQKWLLGFFGLFVSFVQNLPQLLRQVVIFSPKQFLCNFVAGREVCPGASLGVLQQKGPGSQPVRAVWVWNFFVLRLSLQFQFFKIWADQVTFELWWYFFFFFRGLSISSKLLNVWA